MLWTATFVGVVWAGAGVWAQSLPTPSVLIQGNNPKAVEAAEGFLVDLLIATVNANRDNYITQDEVRPFVAGMDKNGNNNLERCEFQDRYVNSYNISGPIASFLYDILNSRSNDNDGSIVFTFTEISDVLTFDQDGDGRVTLKEARTAQITGVYAATVYATQHNDVIIANASTPMPHSIDAEVRAVDADNDGFVSINELVALIATYDTDGNGETSRCEWQFRTESQGFDSKAASLVFDSIDNDHDGAISNAEYIADLLAADTIVPGQKVTVEEYVKHKERDARLSRQQVGLPVRPINYRCEWMNKTLPISRPSFNVELWVEDADANRDDVITQQEYQDVVDTYFEINNNGNLSRCEFHTRALTRYGVNRRQANAIYDSLDTNRDDEVSSEDIDVTLADYNDDGKTTTCELLLFMTYLTSRAEDFAVRRANEIVQERERLFNQAVARQQGGSSDMADPLAALNAYIRGDNLLGHHGDDGPLDKQNYLLYLLFKKWMAHGGGKFRSSPQSMWP